MIGLRTVTAFDPQDAIVPEDRVGPFLPVTRGDIDSFNGFFYDELEKWFSTSLCCCDHCYDDFASHWPDKAFRSLEFQETALERDWFIDGSRMPEVYSAAEMSTLRHFVECTRCRKNVTYNFWGYEHRFEDPELLEIEIEGLLQLGHKTPFLILQNELAQRIHAAISSLSLSVEAVRLPAALYRARTQTDVDLLHQDYSDIRTYSPAPAQFVGEGRFNHTGEPMLYLADKPETALAEIGVEGKPCCLARIAINEPLKVLDLVEIDDMGEDFELLEAMARSALLSAPRTGEGWVKKQYIFSRFVADCAKGAGFDAIRYGSTKSSQGTNYVLLMPPATLDEYATLEHTEIAHCPRVERRL